MNELVKEKLFKAISNLCNTTVNMNDQNKRESIGNLHFAKENIEEVIYILEAELEEKARLESEERVSNESA